MRISSIIFFLIAFTATFIPHALPAAFAAGPEPTIVPDHVLRPDEPLFGTGSADRIVILCSMADTMGPNVASAKGTLQRTVANLKPGQHFGLLFFHDDQVDGQTKENELMPATPENKSVAIKAFDGVKPGGSNTAKAAMEAAFKTKPQLIVLIASGALKDQDAVLKDLAELNKGKAVRINTVGLLCKTTDDADSLKMVSDAAGGTYTKEPALAMFGTPGGGGIGPKGPVFGDGGNARNIVFVCNARLPAKAVHAVIKDHLNKAVTGMRPIQSFNVILAGAIDPEAFQEKQTVAATPENKRKLGTFLEGVTLGAETNPVSALQEAFDAKPQLIYLLTDSDFPDDDALLKRVRVVNRGHAVKINTIVITSKGEKELRSAAVLKTIASENGGTMRIVNIEDL